MSRGQAITHFARRTALWAACSCSISASTTCSRSAALLAFVEALEELLLLSLPTKGEVGQWRRPSLLRAQDVLERLLPLPALRPNKCRASDEER